ncbi:iron-sulfur cluster repair di-iron protein [Aquimarina rhabdastrellae]
MNINKDTLVSDVVAYNYKTATIFKDYHIDFCCNGNRSLTQVSLEKAIEVNELIAEIVMMDEHKSEAEDYQNWSLEHIVDHIYNNHHLYVEKQIPEIMYYLDKIANVHGEKHPELVEIKTLFKECSGDLAMHMKKEELILFPFIKKLAKAKNNKEALVQPPFGTVQNPIAMMHEEHDNEGERFRKIAKLSNNYTPPQDACNSYKVAFALLKEFEEDLHKHIHLENNILFKNAIKTETELNNL